MSETLFARRTFVQLASAGAASALVGLPRFGGARAQAPEPNGSGVRLGVASYSLRKFPRAKAIELTTALGVKYINLKSVHLDYDASQAEVDAARKEVEAAGLTLVGGGTITFAKDTDEDVRQYFEYCRAAGIPLITGTGTPAVMPRVEKFAKQYDIKVAIHNHGPEDKSFPSPYDVLKVVKDMDPRMGLCIDVGHTVRTGTDVVKAVLDAGPRLLDMHVKDLADMSAKDSQVAVGEGKLPFPAIFRALQTIKYPGYVNLEYEINAKDPLPGMQVSFAYMRGVLAGMTPSKVAMTPTAKSATTARG